DEDGIPDEVECKNDPQLDRALRALTGRGVSYVDGCRDSDDDGIPDHEDDDSDGDGFLDSEECPHGPPCPDGNDNGVPDLLEPDSVSLVGGACSVGHGGSNGNAGLSLL